LVKVAGRPRAGRCVFLRRCGAQVPESGLAAIREDAWPLAGSRRFIGQAGSRSHAVEVNARPRQQRRHPATTLTWVEADFWATADADPQWPESFVFLGRIIDTNIAPRETRIIGPLRWTMPEELWPAAGDPWPDIRVLGRVTSPQDVLVEATGPVQDLVRADSNLAMRTIQPR
tara:strand:+ start:1506 stop:2024 length:519 start_codon:yes stop_codon:yes gene_type:complete